MSRKRTGKYPKPKEFHPTNPHKYAGTLPIVSRSNYETVFFRFIDRHPNVKSWSSESIIIKYVSPVDGKTHRYFPDVFVEFIRSDGSVGTELIEIKPFCQTVKPIFTERQRETTKRKIAETYAVNSAKWEAAEAVCRSKGWDFRLITERELFGKK